MGRQATAEGHARILREISEERAAALRRISGRLDALIGELHGSRLRLAQLADPERAQELARYAELRRMAWRYRWYLEVQREAIGLYHHGRLDEYYAIPDAVSA